MTVTRTENARWSLRLLCAVVAAALLIAVTQTAEAIRRIPPDKLTTLRIPKMSAAPTIDGVLDPKEWRESVAVSGVANQKNNVLHPRPTTFFLAWDEKHLYLGCRAWVMPGVKPRVGGRQIHQAATGDAGMELHFKPMGKNVPERRTDSSFKFLINALGFSGDYSRVSVGQLFKNWQPDFEIKARLTDLGSAPKGGRWLEIEVAASADDFELEGPNRAGDQWRLMLGFNHLPMWMQARIPNNTSYFDPGGYCLATLHENVPAAKVTMERLPGPADGRAAVSFSAYNPTQKPVDLQCLARFKDGANVLLEEKKTLTVPAGRSADFVLDKALPKKPEKGAVYYQVAQGDDVLVQYYTYFEVEYPERYMVHQPQDVAFPLRATFNPVRMNLWILGDTYYLPEPTEARALTYVVRPEGGGKPVVQGRIDDMVTFYYRQLRQLPQLQPGTYELSAELQMRGGKTLGPVVRTFNKLDETKVFSEWWDNDLGPTNRVIRPFTPIEVRNDSVSVWGRDYKLDALGLPEQIRSQGEPVLSGPARIVVERDGREQVVDLTGDPVITKATQWRVEFTGKASGAGLTFNTAGWVEQDGLTYIELTYAPAGDAPVLVDGLRIEYPIDDRQADCLLCLGPGGNFSARSSLLLKDVKPGRFWTTLDTGRNGSGMTVGSFYACFWVGSERRGLLWWGDNDKGWVPHNDVPAHEASRNKGAVVMRNNIIGKPFQLTGPRTITFSYMASPFRPLVKGWRFAIRSQDGTFGGPHKRPKSTEKGKKWAYDGWHLLTPPAKLPEEWPPLWAEFKKHADARVRSLRHSDPYKARIKDYVHTSLPLMGYGWKSDDPKVRYFMPEWGSRESYSKTNRDYYVYLAHRAMADGGLRTIYWDIFFPRIHDSLQNGLAYELPDGRIQPGYNGWNIRRYMMRNYSLMQDHDLTPGAQVSHATNAYLLVACGWMDAILDGEFHKLTDSSKMDWVDGYPIRHMRALANGHNWGTAVSWMNKIECSRPRRGVERRKQRDYVRLYDSWYQVNSAFSEDALRFGINDEKVQYVPFWRNTLVTSDDPRILVSMWRLPDRVLLSAFNHNGTEAKDVTLKVDLKGLGLLPELKWQEFVRVYDLEREEEQYPPTRFDYHGRKLHLEKLQPHFGRLVGIRKY